MKPVGEFCGVTVFQTEAPEDDEKQIIILDEDKIKMFMDLCSNGLVYKKMPLFDHKKGELYK